MNIRKAFLVKHLTELLTITTCLNQNKKRKPQMSKKKGSERV